MIMTTQFTDELTENNEPICSICMTDYKENKSKVNLGCQHSFHYSCLLQWNIGDPHSSNHQSCPLCRQDLGVADIVSSVTHAVVRAQSRQNTLHLEQSIFASAYILLYSEQQHGILLTCKDCNHDLEECEYCCRLICRCYYSHTDTYKYSSISARSPFDDNLEQILEEGEIPIMCCAKCFEERDVIVMDYLNDYHGDIDIFDNFDLYEIYYKYYKDKSVNDNSYVYQAGFPTYTWNEFNDYCHEMYSREVLAFDQELIDNIDDSTIIDIQEDIDINDVGNIDEVINEINILYMNNTN